MSIEDLEDLKAPEGASVPVTPHPHDARFAAERRAAQDPWYALALAKASLLEPGTQRRRTLATTFPVTAPAAFVMRYPALVAGASFLLGIVLWRSPWTRNALRLAALWSIKNVLSRKLGTMF